MIPLNCNTNSNKIEINIGHSIAITIGIHTGHVDAARVLMRNGADLSARGTEEEGTHWHAALVHPYVQGCDLS